MSQSSIPSEIRDRIYQVANELYENASREKMPTVDEVRRAAKADMNTTSAVMREWRKQQTSQVAPVVISVPERVKAEFESAVAVSWSIAQEVANESLYAAQKSWDEEREEAEQLRAEMAQAFETQSLELEAKCNSLIDAEEAHDLTKAELNKRISQLEELTQTLHERENKLAALESQLSDKSSRIDELKAELATTHEASKHLQDRLDKANADLATSHAQNKADAERIEDMRCELAESHKEIKELRSQSDHDRIRHEQQINEYQARLDKCNDDLNTVRIKAEKDAEKYQKELNNAQASLTKTFESLNVVTEDKAAAQGELKVTKENLKDLKAELEAIKNSTKKD